MQIPNVIRMAVVLAAATALVAACGVANPFAPAAAANKSQDQLLKWAQCMRQHGVNVPDPVNGRITVQNGGAGGAQPGGSGSGGSTAGSGGDGGNVTTGPDPNSAQFQAAQNACKQYAPNGGKAGGQPTQQQLDQMTKFSQCMREHGIPMSDPQVQSGGGVSIRVSAPPGGPGQGLDPNSDQFKQAQAACAKYQPGGGPNGSRTSNG